MEVKEFTKQIEAIFKSFNTKPILFFGSGMSQRYYSLPNWKELLEHFSQIAESSNPLAFLSYENQAKNIINELNISDDYLYPYIATIIEKDYNQKFFSDSNFEILIKQKYHSEIIDGTSPFKIAVCDYLNDSVKETNTLFNEIIALSGIVNKTSNIITTNYDLFLDKLFKNYVPLVGQSYIFNNKINSIGNIFKIHGSVNQPSSLILTYDDYEKFNGKSKFLSAKLLTLFIEYPIIFLGYSINDANIKNILKDIQMCLNEESAKQLAKKMIFVELAENSDEQDLIQVEVSGIQMQKIKLYDYNILYNSFDIILDSIDVNTLRLLEDKITQLVESTDNSIDRVYATGLENKELTSDNLAVYIGHESSVFNIGYSAIRLINICEDVLFQNKGYDPKGIIENTILSQKGYFNRSKIPIYKYLQQYDQKLDDFFEKNHCIISRIEDIYNSQEKRSRLYKYPITQLSHITGSETNLNKIIDNIYLSLRKLNLSEVKNYLKSIWNRKSELHSQTKLTKIICAIDLAENKKEH